jgi:hypothetical protein
LFLFHRFVYTGLFSLALFNNSLKGRGKGNAKTQKKFDRQSDKRFGRLSPFSLKIGVAHEQAQMFIDFHESGTAANASGSSRILPCGRGFGKSRFSRQNVGFEFSKKSPSLRR